MMEKLISIIYLILLKEGLFVKSEKHLMLNRIVSNALSLQIHNTYRTKLGVPDLVGSFTLAQHAKDCVKYMLFNDKEPTSSHPCKPAKYDEGENIYEMKNGQYQLSTDYFEIAVKQWYGEVKYINFKDENWFFNLNTNNPSKPIGHFTQLVWRSTKKVGCAYGFRNSFKMGSTVKPSKMLVVCRYSPPGNNFTPVKIKANVPVPVQVCEDNGTFCNLIPCEEMFDSVKSECRATCGLC